MDIITFCGIIISVGTALGIIHKWLRPLFDMSAKFEALEAEIAETKNRDDAQDAVLNMCVKGIYFLLRNIRTGNCLDDVERAEKELHDHIFN